MPRPSHPCRLTNNNNNNSLKISYRARASPYWRVAR
jgi:hypothetical protein